MARQADGAILLKCNNLAMLATVVSGKEPRRDASFFPLSVDYQEKFASAGRIPGGFLKRESRLSDYEILICRLVDRAIRPLFPDAYYHDTQVIISLISADKEVLPDSLAAFAASAALTCSDIPFSEPISEVRVARIDGEFVINPLRTELESADLEIIVAATADNIMMVEGEMKEVSEDVLLEALKFGHDHIRKQCEMQIALAKACGKFGVVREIPAQPSDEDLHAAIEKFIGKKIYEIASNASEKHERKAALKEAKESVKEKFITEDTDDETAGLVSKYFSKDRVRLDGRQLDEVRGLDMEVDLLPSPHGSALFTRGETQSLTTVTLGSKDDEKMHDNVHGMHHDRFLLHYNFPAFSTGETKPMRGPSRREVGHGNLAQRSLRQVMPTDPEVNPYTVRVVSDVLESNGSSSMATVCAGSLALMDAGIKIKTGVSGIAMGLISDGDRFAILSDILGDEDHLGDMDFKVTGTINGMTACQMDIKVDGLPYEILAEALEQSKRGRLGILEQMNETIAEARDDYKDHAPRIEKITIDSEFIGAIIGPGGKHIQELQRETGTKVWIEESEDGKHGYVTIIGSEKAGVVQAATRVNGVAAKPEIDAVYDAVVKSIMPYGAFVEIMPGKQGLLHISEVSWKRIEDLNGVMAEGDVVKVKLIGIDNQQRMKLSRKVLLPRPERNADA
ncbi:UNVERIFIED_CONTAM: hypothetical protein GTU68_021288 [Idotea baltica]|nr:hypothetical protein [Idotea baltica]